MLRTGEGIKTHDLRLGKLRNGMCLPETKLNYLKKVITLLGNPTLCSNVSRVLVTTSSIFVWSTKCKHLSIISFTGESLDTMEGERR